MRPIEYHLMMNMLEDILAAEVETSAKLGHLESKLNLILKENKQMSAELDVLTAAVEEDNAVVTSAITLIEGLAAQIAAGANDPAAMLALAAELTAKKDELAQAVAANTPAAPVA